MHHYTSIVDLRISHPSMDPAAITAALGLSPKVSWKAGDMRMTPAGQRLPGFRKATYWSSAAGQDAWRDSEEEKVEERLSLLLDVLERHADALREIAVSGNVRIWMSTGSDQNYALDLPPVLLRRLASLDVGLVHDVYQDD